jgi:hypothetical protein
MNANESGTGLEDAVKAVFRKYHFKPVSWRRFQLEEYLFSRCLITQVPYINAYGGFGRTEFVWHDEYNGIHDRIECKNQNRRGSKEECICYFLDSCEKMPENTIHLIMSGNGWSRCLQNNIQELSQKKAKIINKKINIFKSIDEFADFVKIVMESKKTIG